MQTCILTLGIILVGQLGDSSGSRYQQAEPSQALGGDVAPPMQSPLDQPPIDDNPLRSTNPASTSLPSTNTAPPARLSKVVTPAEFLRNLTKPVSADALIGKQLSLAEAVKDANSRSQQGRLVGLYWKLSQAVAEYRLVALEAVQLQSIYSGLGLAKPNQTWQQAQQTLTARTEVARSAVRVAQLRLQREAGLSLDGPLPLPSDLPHCGAYDTRYEAIFRGRSSNEAQELSQLLPLQYRALGQCTLDAIDAQQWYNLTSQQQSQQHDGTQLLKTYEYLALQRRAFVSTTYHYNEHIARYTELAVPQNVDTNRLVAMLIESDSSPSPSWQRGAIRRASAEEAPAESAVRPTQPRTYAEGGSTRTLRVPIEKNRGERSILVPSKE